MSNPKPGIMPGVSVIEAGFLRCGKGQRLKKNVKTAVATVEMLLQERSWGGGEYKWI
jgi:hypothetical protein